MMRVLGVLLTVLIAADAYKILVYNPKFGHSHTNLMGGFADILTETGHDVTTIISVMDPNVSDGTKLSKIIRIEPRPETKKKQNELLRTKSDFFTMSNFDPIGAYYMGEYFGKFFALQCRDLLEEPGLVDRLKAEKFDVFFAEHFDMCGVGLSHLIQPKSLISVGASTVFGPQFEDFGVPIARSYDSASAVSKLDVHSMWDRIVNIYGEWVVRINFYPIRYLVHATFTEKYGADFPTFESISSNSAYVFTNTEPLIDYALPTISKVIPLGGIGAKEPEPLSEDWVKILTKREKTVLLSLGSVMRSAYLPMEVKQSIAETVKALPHVTFIWKYEEDDEFTKKIASKISNLELTKWMPQVDILAHPRLSAFITHGGMGSTQETALRGVPGIIIPIFGDQPRNAGMMEHNKLGKVLDKTDLKNSAKFIAVIKEVLEDDSYRQNAQRVSAMLQKRPFTAKEQLIKYTEFAAEFGPSKALRPQSHDMNWIEYNNLDIIFIALFIIFICVIVTFKIVKSVCSRLLCIARSKKEWRSLRDVKDK